MATRKRNRFDVDILDSTNGRTYTYTVGPCETEAKAIGLAVRQHGNDSAQWAGNVRITRALDR